MPGLRGYVLCLPAGEHARSDVTPLEMAPFDGIAQLWYDDQEARARAAASAAGRRWHADGATIIGGIRSFVTEEQVAVPLPGGGPRTPLKALSVIRRRADATPETFRRHWRGVHAAMAHGVPELRGFVLSGVVEERFRPDIPPFPMADPVDGFAESRFDGPEARARMVASPEARHWFADGATFLGRVKTALIEERGMIPPLP
ncbi:EthD domain-containing protein [Caldovatus sp. SYSU G05006]|uniref:EthD domain-containing protein n=1 Tax=Caldovatus aquaticus TaxID=2865671 RepID=A0ABS7F7A1_9PROT|nr:EthD domain-containing protein [Caldovatus aquaticus]